MVKREKTSILLPFEFTRTLSKEGHPVLRKVDVAVDETYRSYVTKKLVRAAVQEVLPRRTNANKNPLDLPIPLHRRRKTSHPTPPPKAVSPSPSAAPGTGAEETKDSLPSKSEESAVGAGESTAMEIEERGPMYTLPDGTQFAESLIKHTVPEVLFKASSSVKREDLPLHQLVTAATGTLKNGDQRKDMLNNVVVCGGLSALPGVVDRLSAELNIVAKAAKPRVLVAGLDKRVVLPWIGGSILGSLSGFEELCVSRQEYEESGAALLDKKCP